MICCICRGKVCRMLRAYLVRHAESTLNKEGINQGSDRDSNLTATGKEQAKKLVNKFKNQKVLAFLFWEVWQRISKT